MNCQEATHYILLSLQESESFSQELQDHLCDCLACQKLAQDYQTIFQLTENFEELPPPPDFSKKLWRRIAEESQVPVGKADFYGQLLIEEVTFLASYVRYRFAHSPSQFLLLLGALWLVVIFPSFFLRFQDSRKYDYWQEKLPLWQAPVLEETSQDKWR